MPYELPKHTIVAKPGRSIQTKTGIALKVIIPTPRCIVDGHSHIENGACAPLPLLWDKLPFKPKLQREKIDTLSLILKRQTGKVQVLSSFEIGKKIVDENDNAFSIDTLIGKSKLYGSPRPDSKVRDFYSFLVILMMDMEYAHIAGLYGQTIYHEESPWYYYERLSGTAEENKGKKVLLKKENVKSFQKWSKQIIQTIDAVKANPLRLFPMYFYAPQRWNGTKNTTYDGKKISGPWNYPFMQVATTKNKGLFLGFKMYSPLGHQPLDPRLPYLHDKTIDGDCFYGRCEREGIPIMAHCSSGGMTTHELKFFMDHDTGRPSYQNSYQYSSGENATTSADATAVSINNEEMAVRYFFDNYVHPKAWRKVLKKYPKLRLCLAHFGGDEFKNGLDNSWVTEILALTKEFPDVYADISCWDIGGCKKNLFELLTGLNYAHIREKLIFGTDWYMTLVSLGGKSYRSFCEEAWEAFMEIPDGEKHWVNCTFVNPFTFYGFYDKDPQSGSTKLDNIVSALKSGKHDKAKINENLSCFKRLKKKYEKLLEERKKAKGI